MTSWHTFLLLDAAILVLLIRKSSSDALPETVSLAADANRLFTMDLLQNLVKDGRRNVLFSPLGISSALALASLGARGNTLEEINKVLHFDIVNRGNSRTIHSVYHKLFETFMSRSTAYNLSAASAFFGKDSIDVEPEFQKQALGFYHSKFQSLHGNPELQINQWASQHTNNMIPEIISPGSLTSNILMVLINAVYFKGNWVNPFNKEKTKPRDFFVTPDEPVEVPIMFLLEELPFNFDRGLKAKILELPYGGEEVSMYAILPNKYDGYKSLVEDLSAEKLKELFNRDTFSERKIEVKFPKFKLSLQLPLSKLLIKFGIKDLFSNPDLSGLSPNTPPVADIRHAAAIDVNEEGTEAAAVTAVLLQRALPPEFNANHPFLFFIVHKPTEFILFAGALVNPLE